MPRSANVSVQNTFVKGLVTEATGLNFPQEACTETYNCIFDERGIVERRLGFNFESGYSEQTVDRADVACASYYWKAAAGNGENSLAVIQVGDTLYFYFVGDDALSSDLIDTITISDFKPSAAPSPETVECQFASGNGYLFVSHPTVEPFYVTYDPDTDTVSGTEITVQIRDFEGVEDSLEIDERPSVLSDEHHYNLFNQGWYVDDFRVGGGAYDDVLGEWDDQRSDFPANCDIWHQFILINTSNEEVFAPQTERKETTNTPAPKGHYILDAFYQDRSAASGVSNIDVLSADIYRPSTIEFFAGRVWYAGVSGQKFSTKIYFSQIIEKEEQFGDCYQQNDPTSRETFDLLATDGGVISILDVGTVIKLFALENSLLVFATNGVWSITGSEGLGFKATDFAVRKIATTPTLTASSFVSIGGLPAWWNDEGIFLAQPQDSLGSIAVQSLTNDTIREFYEAIPATCKRFAKGTYNTRERVVYWVYRSDTPADLTETYEYDSVLNFNVLTKSFYPWSVDNSTVSINGVLVVEGQASTSALTNVTNSSLEDVTTSGLEDVQVTTVTTVALDAVTKFVTSYASMGSYQQSFSESFNNNYLDWEAYDDTGVNYSSYFISGYQLVGEATRKFQPNYIYLFNKTEGAQSQCDFNSVWDFATDGDTGRWSTTQRLIFPNADYEYQFKRIKTRGHGVSLQFRVRSVQGQPFHIIGWSQFNTVNNLP